MKSIIESLKLMYPVFKDKNIKSSRIFNYCDLTNILKKYKNIINIHCIGESVENRKIFEISIKNTLSLNTKIFIWSQMHGNETTGTLSILDMLNFFKKKSSLSIFLLQKINFYFIPMLNPDGANFFKRLNSLDIDINRDAKKFSSPESKILFKRILFHKPNFLINLHDQRSIYNIKNTNEPSVLSFLSPSQDYNRTITKTRIKTMNIISFLFKELQKILPNKIGRYSDEFYPNATGDVFHGLGYPCLLIEAGYFNNDIKKKKTIQYNTIAIIMVVYIFCCYETHNISISHYFDIPNNDNKMIDYIYRDIIIVKNNKNFIIDLGIMIEEFWDIKTQKILYKKKITHIGDLKEYFGRSNIMCNKKIFFNKISKENYPLLNQTI